jgi:cation diffusion facilitator family transporter
METAAERIQGLKQGHRVAFIASTLTLFLALMKALVGYLFGVDVLIADAMHSGADLLAIFASGFGLWLATRKKSARFPFGLYRAETLATLLIGGGIAWAGVELFRDGLAKLFQTPSLRGFPAVPIAASVVSIVLALFLAMKEKKVGARINSQSLLINARESFLDIFVSAVVLLGILFGFLGIPYVEGGIIIGISLLVFWLGLKSLWTSTLVLMDANLEPELQSEIQEKINQIYGVKGVGEVKIRQSGPFRMVECRILTSSTLPLYKAHELADKVEDFIEQNYGHIESVFVHVEPAREEVVTAIVPVREIDGLNSRVHGHFGRSPYFIILKLHGDDTGIEDFYINQFLEEKRHIGIRVIKAVISHKLDVLFTSRIGEISFYMLKENFVDIYRIREGQTVQEVLELYRSGSLKKITKPTHPLEEARVESEE